VAAEIGHDDEAASRPVQRPVQRPIAVKHLSLNRSST
jgi:hypothetical protein